MMLEKYWHPYTQGDYKAALTVTTEALCGNMGIDMLHIAGLSLMNLRRYEEGLALLKAAIIFRPESAHIYINSAFICEEVGMTDEVNFFCDAGLNDFPGEKNLLLLRANAMVLTLNFDGAQAIYEQLLKDHDDIQPMVNIGNIHRAKDEFDKAEEMFVRADAVDPDFRATKFARATMYTQMGDDDRAIELLEKLPKEDPDAKFLLSLLYLSKNDYERGFNLYRSRAEAIWYQHGKFVHPLDAFDHWTEATDKKIAVIQEGGLGDMLMFMRYLPKLSEITKELELFTPPNMGRLLEYNLPKTVTVRANATMGTTEHYDYKTTDAEMPYHFRTTIDTIPLNIPYIKVPDEMIEQHRLPILASSYDLREGGLDNPKLVLPKRVGLCWAGGKRDNLNQRAYDDRRSLPKNVLLDAVKHVPGIEFVSLQFGDKSPDPDDARILRALDNCADYMDTAAVVAQLDLVISVDTSVVHLAAAMGKPTWLLSRYDACWRWNRNTTSPWYPNVRIFGQKKYRDWSDPLTELGMELMKWVTK